MPTSSTLSLDDRGALSRCEQQILAGVEDDPAAIDSAWPHEMSHRDRLLLAALEKNQPD